MPEPRDPLRELFKDAAATGQSLTRPVPAAAITARGSAVRRRRAAVLAAAACVAVTCGIVALAVPHGGRGSVPPATTVPGPAGSTALTTRPAAPTVDAPRSTAPGSGPTGIPTQPERSPDGGGPGGAPTRDALTKGGARDGGAPDPTSSATSVVTFSATTSPPSTAF